MTSRESFPMNLRRLLSMGNYSQVDLAKYIGCSNTTVSFWMNGRTYPEANNMEKIARFFQVSVFELVCEDNRDEEALLRKFRKLSPRGKEIALERMAELEQLYWYGKEGIAKEM